MKRWHKVLIMSTVITICISVLLLSGGVAFAATSVDGFNDSIQAILDLVQMGIQGVIDLFGMIL